MKADLLGLLLSALMLHSAARAADSGPPWTYAGTVVDEMNRPVAGAKVDFDHYASSTGADSRQSALTDTLGRFAFSSQPGAAFLLVRKAGLAPAWRAWTPISAPPSDPIILTASSTLEGQVEDQNGRPVANAEVWCLSAVVGDSRSREIKDNLLDREILLDGERARECFSTSTGADGRFRLGNFPKGGYASLAVKKAGRALNPLGAQKGPPQPARGGETSVKLVLAPSGGVEGRVVAEDSGLPVPGVTIALEWGTSVSFVPGPRTIGQEVSTKSGADGTFRLEDVTPGSYPVRVGFPGHPVPEWVLQKEVKVDVKAGETTRGVELRASRGTLVEVTVVATNTLSPIPNVAVSTLWISPWQVAWPDPGTSLATACRLSMGYSACTDANGSVLLRVRAGNFWLGAAKRDWLPLRSRTPQIEAGRTNHFRLELEPASRVTGTVRDPSGAPVAGVIVSFHPAHSPRASLFTEAKTDERGKYELVLQRGSPPGVWNGPIGLTNCILAQSLDRNLAAIEEFRSIPAKLDLTLQPGLTLSGSVKNADGAPVVRAKVELSLLSGHSFRSVGERPAETDEQGRFSFPALPQGRDFSIEKVTATGYGSAARFLSVLNTQTNRYEIPDIILRRSNRILSGIVLGPDGKILAGASVHFGEDGTGQQFSTGSDSAGRFSFETLSGDAGMVDASFPVPLDSDGLDGSLYGHSKRVRVGETNLVLDLHGNANPARAASSAPRFTVSGAVFNPDGTPASGVEVIASNSNLPDRQTRADSKGNYSLRWRPWAYHRPGTRSRLYLTSRDLERHFVATGVIDETMTNLSLHLRPALTVSGSILSPEGAPLGGARVSIGAIDSAESFATNTDARGRFSFGDLAPDESYSITAIAAGFSREGIRAAWRDPSSNRLELPAIKLRAANLHLAGQVLDLDGKPAPKAQVALIGGVGGQTTADDEGRFLFTQVPAGQTTVWASLRSSDDGPLLSGHVKAQGGDTNVVVKLEVAPKRSRSTPTNAPGLP